MDWKAQIAEKTLIGTLALFGAWIVKRSRPAWKWAVALSDIATRVDKLELELSIERSSRLAALKATTDPVYIIDKEGNLTFVNPAFLAMTGLATMEDAMGRSYMQAIHEDDVENVKYLSDELVKHPSSIEKKVRWRNIKDGVVHHTICRSELVRDKNGVLIERIGIISIIKQ